MRETGIPTWRICSMRFHAAERGDTKSRDTHNYSSVRIITHSAIATTFLVMLKDNTFNTPECPVIIIFTLITHSFSLSIHSTIYYHDSKLFMSILITLLMAHTCQR